LNNSESSHRLWRVAAALLVALLPVVPAHGRVRKSDAWARSQFDTAERMREALNGRPAQERTRQQYQRVINAYLRIYFGSPTSSKADPSVVAVAELQVEIGRRFEDDAILRAAIQQYEFLRKEYPGSKYRVDALFTVGEIYKDDLNDRAKAKSTFEDFLKRYPHSHLADDARAALAEPVQQASLKARSKTKEKTPKEADDSEDNTSANASNEDPPTSDLHASKIARVTSIRHWSTPDYTRIAIDVEQDVKFDSQRIANPNRIFFDLSDTKLASTLVGKTFDVDDGFLKKIRVAQFKPGKTRIVLEVDELSDYNAFLLSNPSRLIIDIHGKEAARKSGPLPVVNDDEASATPVLEKPRPTKTEIAITSKPESPKPADRVVVKNGVPTRIVDADDGDDDPSDPGVTPPPSKAEVKEAAVAITTSRKKARAAKKASPPEFDIREAQPTASGDRSLIRALGLKIGKIVIDAGHGGHDTGTIGPNGLLEKDLVLDVAKRLGKQLERLGAEVVYTLSDDTFIPLETRTAIANQEQADLFISIHANSSSDPDARGVETYYLNFTSSRDALDVAARENAVSENSIHELQDLVKKIALKEKIDESHEFASDVQSSLHSGLAAKNPGIRDRGVKKAPFIVLIGANMPSILAEISFVSNPGDERRLQTAEYRQRIAESLYRGIAKYVNGLSGVKVASKIDKSEGQ